MQENGWRNKITNRLVPECGYYYIVYDPDYLIGDEKLYIQLKEKGFELLTYTHEIDFRILFEEKIRTYIDKNLLKELIIFVHEQEEHINIPYDLLIKSTSFSIDLPGIIPMIDADVLRSIPLIYLDKLYGDEIMQTQKRLPCHESKKFVLRMIYGIDPILIRNKVQLLRFLLHIHYDKLQIPKSLLYFVSEQLSKRDEFNEYDIKLFIHNRDCFYSFLEENLNREGSGGQLLQYNEINVYIEKMVQDQLIYIAEANSKLGTYTDKASKTYSEKLMNSLVDIGQNIPNTYMEWLSFMCKWSTMTSAIYTNLNDSSDREVYSFLDETKYSINKQFKNWLELSYGSLYNHPPSAPVMVHHIPRYISQRITKGKRVSLIVVDGLSMTQWKVLEKSLKKSKWVGMVKEKALFAWVPTLTSVSRQALLSGKIPLSISRFLYDTSREEKLWNNFWEDRNLMPGQILFKKIAGESTELGELHALMESNYQVAAIIITKIDSIMHGQKQGLGMMHKEVQHWAELNFFSELLAILSYYFDDIFLTSDHGNDEAVGIGSLSQGALVKEQGQRCRIYDSYRFRKEAQDVYPNAIPWPQIGLPEKYFPLLAPHGKAFTKSDTKIVTHGGVSIDEVIVPFIHFSGDGKLYE